jgi:hypothetical protein
MRERVLTPDPRLLLTYLKSVTRHPSMICKICIVNILATIVLHTTKSRLDFPSTPLPPHKKISKQHQLSLHILSTLLSTPHLPIKDIVYLHRELGSQR